MSFAPVVTILQSARTKVAKELQDCNRVCQILILTHQRVTSPCFLPKKSTDRAKSNPVFFSGRRRGDRMRWVWLSVSLVQSDCRARLRRTNVSWQVLKFAVFKKLFCVQTLKLTEITFFSDFKF